MGLLKKGRSKKKPPKANQGFKGHSSALDEGWEVIKTILECWSRVPFWNPLLVLYGAPLPSDSSI